MAEKMRLKKIYLLNEDKTIEDVIIKTNKLSHETYETENGDLQVYKYKYSEKTPEDDFFPDNLDKGGKRRVENRFAIFYVKPHKDKNYTFVAFEGDCRKFVDVKSFDKTFSKKTVLSNVGITNFKKLNKTSVASNDRNQIQKGTATPFRYLAFDSAIDEINGFSCYIELPDKKTRMITAHLGVEYNKKVSFLGIIDEFNDQHKLFISEKYKEKFSFIDDMKDVTNKDDIMKLRLSLIDEMNKKESEQRNFTLTWPDEVESATEYRIYSKDKGNKLGKNDAEIQKVFEDLTLPDVKFSLRNIDTFYIQAIFEGTKLLKEYNLEMCMTFMTVFDEKRHYFNNNKWIRVDGDFHEKINHEYLELMENISKTKLLDWDRNMLNDEGKYNEELASIEPEKGKHKYYNLDKEIKYFTKYEKMEIADILDIDNNSLIAIKKGTATSLTSHLRTQIDAAIGVFGRDIKKVQEIIDKVMPDDERYDAKNIRQIVLGIATQGTYAPPSEGSERFEGLSIGHQNIIKKYELSDEKLPHIPFLARVAVTSLFRQNNYASSPTRLEIKWIKYIPKKRKT